MPVEFYTLKQGEERVYDREAKLYIYALERSIVEFRVGDSVDSVIMYPGHRAKYSGYIYSIMVKEGSIFIAEDVEFEPEPTQPTRCSLISPLSVTGPNQTATWSSQASGWKVHEAWGWLFVWDTSTSPPTLIRDGVVYYSVKVDGIGGTAAPPDAQPFPVYRGRPKFITVTLSSASNAPATYGAGLALFVCYHIVPSNVTAIPGPGPF